MPSPREGNHGGETSSSKMSDSCKPDTKSKSSKDTPPGSPASTTSLISDDCCPICLGNITDKCMANSCHHCFCLVCLKEWSRQKAVCPLCKESFTKIIYDIKSDTDFKEWKVPRLEQSHPITNFQAFFVSHRRFFGYRTTHFPGAATLRHHHPVAIPDAIPSGPRERSSASYNVRGSSAFRLNIYLNNEWVQPIADITGRYRQSSPELYREQPALTHRLVPWVNRELAALVHSTRIAIVLTQIMDLIERYPINSREFRRAVRPHLGNRTNHFVHEFYHFARSPYDMVGHDNAARYVMRHGFTEESTSDSSSSDDSDAVVEVDARGNPVSSTTSRTHEQGSSAAPNNVEREETLTQEGSVLISSDESSSNEIPQQANLFVQNSASQSTPSETDYAGRGPASATSAMNELMGRARNFLNSINQGASTSLAEESTTTRSSAKKTMKREAPSYSDDSEDCLIVEEVNKREQTPEIITLDSEEERLQLSSLRHGNKSKRKCGRDTTQAELKTKSSHSHKEKKGRKKPSLNRMNFPIFLGESSATTSSTSMMSNRDHSYCNVEDAEEPFHSVKRQSVQPSSSEDVANCKVTKTVQTSKDTDKGLVISSDSESVYQNLQRKKRKHKDKRSKTRRSSSQKYEEQGDGCGSSSWHDTGSPAREKFPPTKRRRKDHHSKVKNSSKSHSSASSHKNHNYSRHCASEMSSNSWCNSDSLWTPPSSSATESRSSRSSSRNDHRQDGSTDECSPNPRSSQTKETRREQSYLKSKYCMKRGKHKKKDKLKEKIRKSKKGKHKKKSKSRRISSSSGSDSDSMLNSLKRRTTRTKKRRRIKESSSSSSSPDLRRKRQIRYNDYSSSD